MKDKYIRWKQRFEHFERTFHLLEKAVSLIKPSEIESAGLVQFYEKTFELSWKMMKDFLEEEGKRLQYLLNEETSLPYFFDILSYNEIDNKELLDHIDRVGKVIFKQSPGGSEKPK